MNCDLHEIQKVLDSEYFMKGDISATYDGYNGGSFCIIGLPEYSFEKRRTAFAIYKNEKMLGHFIFKTCPHYSKVNFVINFYQMFEDGSLAATDLMNLDQYGDWFYIPNESDFDLTKEEYFNLSLLHNIPLSFEYLKSLENTCKSWNCLFEINIVNW